MGKWKSWVDPTQVILNEKTGEVKKYVHHERIGTEQFIMVYLYSIPDIMRLESGQIKMLMCCWAYSDYSDKRPEGNVFVNNADFKGYLKDVAGLDMSATTINSTLSRLVGKGYLIRRHRGSYMLNPKYFFKGTLTERSKLVLHLEVG